MVDVYLYEGCANAKDLKLRYAGETEGPPPPTEGYGYGDGLVSVQVAG